MTRQEYLINEIILVCKVTKAKGEFMDLSTIWINLIGLTDGQLTKIAKTLYINTNVLTPSID